MNVYMCLHADVQWWEKQDKGVCTWLARKAPQLTHDRCFIEDSLASTEDGVNGYFDHLFYTMQYYWVLFLLERVLLL